jgi:hypothetical protein
MPAKTIQARLSARWDQLLILIHRFKQRSYDLASSKRGTRTCAILQQLRQRRSESRKIGTFPLSLLEVRLSETSNQIDVLENMENEAAA